MEYTHLTHPGLGMVITCLFTSGNHKICLIIFTMKTIERLRGREAYARGVYSTGIWVGGFGRLNETLTLFKTDVNFATPSKRKCCNFLPCSRLNQAGRIQNTKNGT